MNIGFMGAGRVGGALGLYFKKHGLCVAGYYSRQFTSAKQAALLTETAAFPTFEALAGACSMIFFTTPDHVLEEMDKRAASYVRQTEDPGAKTWVHVSGVFPSSHLHSLQALGCPVGSMHPLQSFGAPECSAPLLENTSFSLEGTQKAQNDMQAVLQKTGGRYRCILPEQKPLYHAGASIISNYMVTVIDSGMRCMEAAGMDRQTLYSFLEPLILGTLQNLKGSRPEDALTGPIVRGDVSSVAAHLEAIQKSLPEELALYKALARKTVSLAREGRLAPAQAQQLQDLLQEG
ncbi:MAG: DUF2520 domain-containing protein [Oscillospiraceae bacterium]|nr:DUF2520 domain-containing protein [Oscillospiraceae bacterium]